MIRDHLDRLLAETVTAALSDLARCVADARTRKLTPEDFIYIVGAPRVVARMVPGVDVCDCRVLAVGLERDDVLMLMRANTSPAPQALVDDVALPLRAGWLRLLVFTAESSTAPDLRLSAVERVTPPGWRHGLVCGRRS